MSKKSILAIDDSPTMRNMLRLALSGEDYDITLAVDGVDGIEKLAEADPAVVITDINMPRLDGFGVIDQVRQSATHPNVPILVLTTESAAELKQKAKAAGATGWIVKPFNREKLVSVLARLVA